MDSYEVSQKILSIGATYQVRAAGDSDVLYTVKGKVIAVTPKLTMVQGDKGDEVAVVTGNFFKTTFTIKGADGSTMGVLSFPLIMLKKSFTLSVGGQQYKASGGLLGRAFSCEDSSGTTVFEVKKELALKDKFAVNCSDALPREVAFLATVAIDQKFFEDDD